MGFRYIIEHMEEDDDTPRAIPPWVELEYAHMRVLGGADAHVHFTSLSSASQQALASAFAANDDHDDALASVECHTAGVLELLPALLGGGGTTATTATVCLLDPKSPEPLAPADGTRFTAFLFGGILGDDPPRDRTAQLRALGFPTRHLGPHQMTTDTALGVTKRVVHDKVPLSDIPYVDNPTISFNAHESVQMPFRYIADPAGNPILPRGMRQLLHQDLNKSFDF